MTLLVVAQASRRLWYGTDFLKASTAMELRDPSYCWCGCHSVTNREPNWRSNSRGAERFKLLLRLFVKARPFKRFWILPQLESWETQAVTDAVVLQLLPQHDYDTDFLKASTAGELRDPSCGWCCCSSCSLKSCPSKPRPSSHMKITFLIANHFERYKSFISFYGDQTIGANSSYLQYPYLSQAP